jgi:hypothetical protein
MATTVYAQRCAQMKERFARNLDSKEPNFITQWNYLWGLSNLGRLSRMNCIWLGKQINAMSEAWHEPNQLEMIEQLRERQARAWKRWEKRIAERAAAKLASGGKRTKKEPTTPAPVAPVDIDVWED